MNFENCRTDMIYKIQKRGNQNVEVEKHEEDGRFYHLISFSRLIPERELTETLKREITSFIEYKMIDKPYHVFIVGIGNDSHTADSIGPKTLKHLHINSHLQNMGLKIKGNIVSSLEPGVLGETGIETTRIVESIKNEIKPDFLILIDSLVTADPSDIGKTLVLSDEGLTPGSGLKGLNSPLNEESLGIPTLMIGIPVALEITLSSKEKDSLIDYLLTPSDIDNYVERISEIIASGINSTISQKE